MSQGLPNRPEFGSIIPDDLYIELVRALFADKKALILGSVATGLCGIVTILATQSGIAAMPVAAMATAALLRITDFNRFGRMSPDLDLSTARHWELRYTIGAAGYMALLGLWTFAVFEVTADEFPRMLALTATLGHSLGIATRNFSFVRGTNAQIVAALIPLCLTFVVAGGRYLIFIPFVVVPILVFIKGSAARLRQTFLEAALLAREKSTLATRFDTALNNMPHGLCMLDGRNRVVIANEKLLEILGWSRNDLPGELGFDIALRQIVRSGRMNRDDGRRLRRLVRARVARPPLLIDFDGQGAAEITVHPMESGGSVIVVQDVTERRNAERIIDRMAYVDPVTELPNRRRFEEQLAITIQACGEHGRQAAIFFLDLDDFKQVNDSLGHASGDALLRIVAERLRSMTRATDLIARWGGDEFAILLSPTPTPDQSALLADRIIREVSRPCTLADTEHVVGVSIGVANIPVDGLLAKTILSKADIALYVAKSAGRNQWRVFASEMEEGVKRRRLLEMALRAAVAADAIDVYYQPIVATGSHRIVGFEALARWHHPTRGFVPPSEFIPLVEELGLMSVMGAAILRKACVFCATLPGDIRISVNLSPTQFWHGDVVETVRNVLRETGLESHRLDLEITESTLLDDRPATRAAIVALRTAGVKVALDDFGTGYSSLVYLLTVPLDRIKIDRAFTSGLGLNEPSAILIEGVAQISRRLGISVVIEGVETAEQLARIEASEGIAEAQGFFFSRPVPAGDVPALLLRSQLPAVWGNAA